MQVYVIVFYFAYFTHPESTKTSSSSSPLPPPAFKIHKKGNKLNCEIGFIEFK